MSYTSYINREIENAILSASQNYPVVMVCGQRQVGKSTMLQHLMPEGMTRVTFQNNNMRHLAETDPDFFFDTYKPPILIDEFQYVPSILSKIKCIIDDRDAANIPSNGLFWLTGSQRFSMMKGASETLVGRVRCFELSTLSSVELDGRNPGIFHPDIDSLRERTKNVRPQDVHDIFDKIFIGGMPKIIDAGMYKNKTDREGYYADYVDLYLEKDIHLLSQVGDLGLFYKLLVLMAANTGQLLNVDLISKKLGIAYHTAERWISILERSGVIRLVEPYYSNILQRMIKSPKVYFMDTGLACYLGKWTDPRTLEEGNMAGHMFETYVVSEILKSYMNNGSRSQLYFYRDYDKKEVDLLIVEGDTIYPIEVKKGETPEDAKKNLVPLLNSAYHIMPEIIICNVSEFMPYDRNTWLFPVAAL
ncbi:MAG: ATP-binding protein [Clostridia bacterium]|nr:ATP-binding protein [Clostridia bacterium]